MPSLKITACHNMLLPVSITVFVNGFSNGCLKN